MIDLEFDKFTKAMGFDRVPDAMYPVLKACFRGGFTTAALHIVGPIASMTDDEAEKALNEMMKEIMTLNPDDFKKYRNSPISR